ncbi:MAG: hypothetical protein ACKO0W_11590 [Planctomycetota bacterium]|jgi:hypothetical protein
MSPKPNDIPRDDAGETPRDVARLARLLDEEGRDARAGLAPDALERIFAASDLQLPLAEPVRPVAGRILPRRPRTIGMPWEIGRVIRIAASVALVASLFVAAFFIQRALRGSGGTGATPRESQLATAPVAPVAPAASRAPAPEHFEAAIGGALAVRTTSVPAAGVVAALASRDAGGTDRFDDDDALSDLAPMIGADAGASYDDLFGEVAAIAALTAPR